MKKTWKKLLILCLLAFLFVPSAKVDAAKPYMKRMRVSWDLKKKKQMTYKNYYGGLGLRNEYVKIISYKKKKVGKKYKVTMKIRFECIKTIEKMSRADRDRFLEYDNGEGLLGDYNVAIVDYNTGKNLCTSNKYGVKASVNYKQYREKSFTSSDGEYEDSFVNKYATVTITYPKKYKNLCVGVGGSYSEGYTDEDEEFYEGYGPFSATSFNYKKIMHFMRVK